MIALEETHKKDGTHAGVTGIRTASVTIRPDATQPYPEAYKVTTVRLHEGTPLNGSTRYRSFTSYTAAVAYALGYANRIAKQKREKDAHA